MRHSILFRNVVALAAPMLVFSGCAQAPQRPAWRYLQRPTVRVAILPAINSTTKPGAQIIVDKAWEDNLRNAGFSVVDADSVVTYASSRSMRLDSLEKVPTDSLGRDLSVDFILEDKIIDWGTHYQVIQSVSSVSCRSRLIEAKTGATVWTFDWFMSDQDNNSGGGIVGALANAVVKAVADSMFDEPTRLAQQGITIVGTTQPYPGIAPPAAPQ